MPRLNSIRALVTCFVLLVPATPLWAEDYPSKPIRILAGAAPGGLIDLFARTFAQRLQERSGQPVVVENNSVATGTIGADLVAKSPPDGYTLLLGHPANVTIWPMINPKLPYNPGRDFAPIALVGPSRQPAAGIEKLAHTFGAGVDCDGEGAAGNADICFARRGELGSHGDRAVQARRRNRPDPRPLSRLDAGDDRPDRWPSVAHHRHGTVQSRSGARGCVARAGRRLGHPRAGAAGCSDHGRGGRTRRAGRIVARAVCPGKYPARGHCLPEQGGRAKSSPWRMFASAWSRRAWCCRKDRRTTSPRSSPSRTGAGAKSSSTPRSNFPAEATVRPALIDASNGKVASTSSAGYRPRPFNPNGAVQCRGDNPSSGRRTRESRFLSL